MANVKLIFCSFIVIVHSSSQHLPTVLLKQAAETLLKTPLTRKYQESGYARLEIPEAEDLLIRRLQAKSQNEHFWTSLYIEYLLTFFWI